MTKIITCRDLHGKESQTPVDRLKFRPSVYGILIEDNKILLSRQWDGYDFPGGGIKIDETIEEALKREFVEETEQEYADMPEWMELDKIYGMKFFNSVDSIALIELAKQENT